MRTYETPYTADWFAISLRWAVMLGCVVSLALGERTHMAAFLAHRFDGSWNMGMTVSPVSTPYQLSPADQPCG